MVFGGIRPDLTFSARFRTIWVNFGKIGVFLPKVTFFAFFVTVDSSTPCGIFQNFRKPCKTYVGVPRAHWPEIFPYGVHSVWGMARKAEWTQRRGRRA